MLEVKNVTKRFGGIEAVSDVSIKVEQGRIVGLIGTNGSGKTTLFNLIGGFYAPDSGEIIFRGERIQGKPPYAICRRGIARTFQTGKPLRSMTVLQNVMTGAHFGSSGSRKTDFEGECLRVLEVTGLSSKKDWAVSNITFAELKRLELARVLSTRPSLIMLDEIMAGLTPTETAAYVSLLRGLQSSGLTILIIEHAMRAMMTLAERVYVLNSGAMIAEGTPQEVASNSDVISAYLGSRKVA